MSHTLSLWSVPRMRVSALFLVMLCSVAAGVGLPWIIHTLGGVSLGQTLLPMLFVVLFTAALFGWEMGLVSGAVIPLTSHFLSGMPVSALLGPVILESSVAGLFMGVFHSKLRIRLFPSVVTALILSKLLLVLWVAAEGGGINRSIAMIVRGWPGMLLQIVLMPLLASFLIRVFRNRDR